MKIFCCQKILTSVFVLINCYLWWDVNDLVALLRDFKLSSIDKFVLTLDRYSEWFALEDEHWIRTHKS